MDTNRTETPIRPGSAALVEQDAGVQGAHLAAQALKAHGVRRVFAVCGDHVNALFHAVDREGIEIIGARHESAAVQMADGLARATGAPGVAIVTGGPGHTNAVTGAAVAQGAQSPVLLLSGQAPLQLRERGGNQSLHQAELMRPVTKWAVEVDAPEGAGDIVSRALSIAVAGTPGPVSVSLPVDVAMAFAARGRLRDSTRPLALPWVAGTVPARATSTVARLLASAERPVVVVGGNAWSHGSPGSLARSLRALGLPTFTNGQSRGVIADDGKWCFGYANPAFNTTFRSVCEADLLILIGTTLDYSFGSGRNRVVPSTAHIVQVNVDPSQISVGFMPDAVVVGDHASALVALEEALSGQGMASRFLAWRRRLQRHWTQQQGYWMQMREHPGARGTGVHPASLCHSLQEYLAPGTTMVFDVGDFANWPKAFFAAQMPARFMDGGALGNLGGALPLAIGAQIAGDAAQVWAFMGDGGFGFHAWELSVAVERRLPLKVILGDDHCWGTEKRLQQMEFGRDIGCDLPSLRYDRFARMLGAEGFHAASPVQLGRVLPGFIRSPGPSVLHVALSSQAGRPFQSLQPGPRRP